MFNPLPLNQIIPVIYLIGAIFGVDGLCLLIWFKGNLSDLFKSNLGQRYLGWLIVIGLFASAVFVGGWYSLLILTMVLLLGIWEVYVASKLPKIYILGLFCLSIISVLIAYLEPTWFYYLPIVYFLVFSTIGLIENSAKKSLINTSISTYMAMWLIFSLTHFVLLAKLNIEIDGTRNFIMTTGFAVVASDIGAYIIGKSLSQLKFLPQYKVASNLSPKKSIIGVSGNIIGAYLGIQIGLLALPVQLEQIEWILLAILIGIFGVIGDITSSMFKRYYLIKDSSQLIPGHGGVIDRIDSTLRVILVIYYYLKIFH